MGDKMVELPKPKIAPSMLSSDFANLASEAKHMEDCGADWLHMDIMVRFHAFLDCHLMVTNPSDYVKPLAEAGASSFTFHVEVTKDDWQELIKSIKSSGMRPAVDGGLGPSTIDQAAAAGANVIVAGSSVFGAKEPASVISILRESVEAAQSSKAFLN
ncbi:hypothetical protein R1sor_003828 [Riccia sorocarpa]|uniref:Ribulose-phosphate 3-epimerase n=1 Tax=Riccia sorocarpa TaxID=122646 RepID=A0ABD3H4I4_9MARC